MAASSSLRSSIRWSCSPADRPEAGRSPNSAGDTRVGFSNGDFNVTVRASRARSGERVSMKTKSGFFGVYPMVYALFDDKGNLARDPMRRQIQSMLKHKVHGIGVLGLASEVNKLSTAERRQLMEWVAEDIGGK